MVRTLLSILAAAAVLGHGAATGQELLQGGWSPPKALEAAATYPITIAPADPSGYVVDYDQFSDGTHGLTVIGRTCLWWKMPDPRGDVVRHLELQADNVVVFLSGQASEPNLATSGEKFLGQGLGTDQIRAIYLEGNVQMAEDTRSIRCDQLYYDLQTQRAMAVDAVLRTFSPQRGVPIYVRASRLRQRAQDAFSAEGVVVTTSEFYVPQVSFSAAKVVITDTTGEDGGRGNLTDHSFVAEMNDVRVKYYDHTLARLPSVRMDLAKTDVPLRGAQLGYDGIWGASVKTQWRLSKVLGLQPPEGTDGSLLLDYYGKRGPGGGVEIDYERDTHFGRVLGYGIYDSGLDTLGRIPERRDIEPPDEARGRFTVQHRQFLPRQWQLTGEISYLSDENFLEQYYRREFNVEKEQETLIHLKRINDNQGFSLLAKGRINDFADTVEEAPSAQFHWVGQSFFDDRVTFYSDSAVSRLQYRPGQAAPSTLPTEAFTFMSTRNELDMPLTLGATKVVPFAAATLGYDDGAGFTTDVDNDPVRGGSGVWFGEAGVRSTFGSWWKAYPNTRSRFWDLEQLRHVVAPRVLAVSYWQNESAAQQRDVLDLGLSQRLQTKRGLDTKQRTVDWLQWDLDFVWVGHAAEDARSPNYLIWSEPSVPLADRFSTRLPPVDRRTSTLFGAYRDYIGSDLAWRLTDSTSILADGYFDTRDQAVTQLDVGISHVRWPDLSYYIGSRYSRDFDNGLGQKGTHAVTVATTYKIDPRYTAVLSEQYDIEHGAGIRSALSLIRQYHRVSYGITLGVDESLHEVSIVFGLWPQGMPELGAGLNQYRDLGL